MDKGDITEVFMKRCVFYAIAAALLVASVNAQVKGAYLPYSVKGEFTNVTNYKGFEKAVKLDAQHLEALKKNLFVCYPSGDHSSRDPAVL